MCISLSGVFHGMKASVQFQAHSKVQEIIFEVIVLVLTCKEHRGHHSHSYKKKLNKLDPQRTEAVGQTNPLRSRES